MNARAVVRLALLALLLVVSLIPIAVLTLFGLRPKLVALYLRIVGRILGLRVKVVGRPIEGPALYAANHIAWLDIPALGGIRYTRFIAKSQIAKWPVIGLMARVAGSVFVQRERRSATRDQADEIMIALNEGHPLALFAEGGTGDGVRLSPFRPALFAAAVETGATVQPVAIDYGDRSAEIAWPNGASFGDEMRRMLNRPAPVHVTITYLTALDARELNRKVLSALSETAVSRALGREVAPA